MRNLARFWLWLLNHSFALSLLCIAAAAMVVCLLLWLVICATVGQS